MGTSPFHSLGVSVSRTNRDMEAEHMSPKRVHSSKPPEVWRSLVRLTWSWDLSSYCPVPIAWFCSHS